MIVHELFNCKLTSKEIASFPCLCYLLFNFILLIFFFYFLRYWHLKSGWKINTRLHNKLLKSG